jgi:hypothetical protein
MRFPCNFCVTFLFAGWLVGVRHVYRGFPTGPQFRSCHRRRFLVLPEPTIHPATATATTTTEPIPQPLLVELTHLVGSLVRVEE